MKSTEILIIEHKLILQALSHLFAAKERLEKDEKPPVEFFRMAIVFFKISQTHIITSKKNF